MSSNYLFISDYNLPNKELIFNSIKCDYSINELSYKSDVNRIGLLWNNQTRMIPFGDTPHYINKNNDKLLYFSNELINFFIRYDEKPIIIDFITCNLNSQLFLNELEYCKKLFKCITFNYSINNTGSTINSDWIMESSNENIKDIYFNDNINQYNYELIDYSFGLGNWTVVGNTYIQTESEIVLSTWSSPIDLSAHIGKIFDGNNCVVTINILNFSNSLFNAPTTSNVDWNNMATLANINITVNGSMISGYGPLFNAYNLYNNYLNVYNCNAIINGNIINSGGLFSTYIGWRGFVNVEHCNVVINGNILNGGGGIFGTSTGGNGTVNINKCSVLVNGDINGKSSGGIFGDIFRTNGSTTVNNCYVIVSGNVTNNSAILFGSNNLITQTINVFYKLTFNNCYGVILGEVDNTSRGFINNNETTELNGLLNCGILSVNKEYNIFALKNGLNNNALPYNIQTFNKFKDDILNEIPLKNSYDISIIYNDKSEFSFKLPSLHNLKITLIQNENKLIINDINNYHGLYKIINNLIKDDNNIKYVMLKEMNINNNLLMLSDNIYQEIFKEDILKKSLIFVDKLNPLLKTNIIKNLGFSVFDMVIGKYTKTQYDKIGITIKQLLDAGFTTHLLRVCNYTLNDVKQFLSFDAILKQNKYSVSDYINTGFTKDDFLNKLYFIMTNNLLNSNDIYNFGFSKAEYIAKGITLDIASNYGFTLLQIQTIGFSNDNPLFKKYVWEFYRYDNLTSVYPASDYNNDISFVGNNAEIFESVYLSSTSITLKSGYYIQPRYQIIFNQNNNTYSVKFIEEDIITQFSNNNITILTQPAITVTTNNNVTTIIITYKVFNGYAYRTVYDVFTSQ